MDAMYGLVAHKNPGSQGPGSQWVNNLFTLMKWIPFNLHHLPWFFPGFRQGKMHMMFFFLIFFELYIVFLVGCHSFILFCLIENLTVSFTMVKESLASKHVPFNSCVNPSPAQFRQSRFFLWQQTWFVCPPRNSTYRQQIYVQIIQYSYLKGNSFSFRPHFFWYLSYSR